MIILNLLNLKNNMNLLMREIYNKSFENLRKIIKGNSNLKRIKNYAKLS